jgi:hypothetical protein
MAFLVRGAGTSIGAMSGALIIARRRVVSLTVALLLAGAVILGWTHHPRAALIHSGRQSCASGGGDSGRDDDCGADQRGTHGRASSQ